MLGNKPGLVLQERDKRLLAEVAVMRVVNRELVKEAAGFRSTTRANTRLLALTGAGLLKRLRIKLSDNAALYGLTASGAKLAGATDESFERSISSSIGGTLFLEHQLAINSIYVLLKHRELPDGVTFDFWRIFQEPLSTAAPIIPDGYFEIQRGDTKRAAFLEVDLGTETLADWQKKCAGYLQIAVSGAFSKLFGQPQFRVLVVVNSDRRLRSIRSEVSKHTDKIFWFATLEAINREGFWSPIWLLPTGEQKHSLV
jgi:hypothetical protein